MAQGHQSLFLIFQIYLSYRDKLFEGGSNNSPKEFKHKLLVSQLAELKIQSF